MADFDQLVKYEEGYKLAENEYLLKVRGETGFMTKFNKNGSMPVAFDTWEQNKWNPNVKNPKLPIYIVGEIPREGWKIVNWRFGMSQNWATMMHPLGYTVEIYLQDLLEIINNSTVINGELMGEYMWKDHKLVK